MKKKILLPTDFSKNSEAALRYIIQLFDLQQANFDLEVMVLFVDVPMAAVQPDMGLYVETGLPLRESHRKKEVRLKTLVDKWRREFPNVSFLEMLATGQVISSIREVAIDVEVEMIAMGASGMGALERTILGSNSVALSREAPCTVLIVPSEASIKRPTNVIFATDFKNLSNTNILKPLREVVQGPNSSLMLLHIFKEDSEELGENVVLAREIGKYFGIEKFDYSFLEGSNKLTSIEEFATGFSADLLAVVAQERTFFQEIFHRSLTRRLLVHTRIPILVLHRCD